MGPMPEKQTFIGGVQATPGKVITKLDVDEAKRVSMGGGDVNTAYSHVERDGVRGTLLPSAKGELGGSYGFDPKKKLDMVVVNLDTGDRFTVPGGSTIDPAAIPSVQEYEKLTPARRQELHEAMKQAVKQHPPAPSMDGLFKELASDAALQAEIKAVHAAFSEIEGVAAPIPPLKDVARAPTESTRGSGGISIYDHTRKEGNMEGTPEAPAKRIIFDHGGVVGQMETYYHDIVKNGNCLVLCWDTRWTGTRYIPGVNTGYTMRVIVGKEREELLVRNMGVQFTLPRHRLELTVLIVDTKAEVPESADGLQREPGTVGGTHAEVQFM